MEISIYSTIDFSKARNLLTERQKNVKAFNPIVPEGGVISLLELNPHQYSSIVWTLINEKTGKITTTTAESSDSMHYVAIPEGLRFGTYTLKIVTTRILEDVLITETTISNPFEFVEATEDIITIVSRNLENDLVGNVPPNATILQPIYVNPLNLVDLADVQVVDIEDGQVVAWDAASEKFKNANQASGGGGLTKQTLTDAAAISWDASAGNWGVETIQASRTQSNPTNLTIGQTLLLDIRQGTGGGFTITWGSYFKFGGGIQPILSSVAGQTDSLEFIVVSATEIRFVNANFNV